MLYCGSAVHAGEDDIKDALKKKISFEFKDTSLADVAKFLTTLTKVPVRIDAKVTGAPVINLKVTDMELGTALEWITKLAELEYFVGKTEIVIGPPKK